MQVIVNVGMGLTALAGFIAATVFIAKFTGSVAGAIRKFVHLRDDLLGQEERPGVPARPSLLEQVAQLAEAVAQLTDAVANIQAEVNFNHGSSVKDHVVLLREELSDLRGELVKIQESEDKK